jgi:hypothetical protein
MIAPKADFPENIFVAKNPDSESAKRLFSDREVMRGFIGVVMRVVLR